MKALFIFLLVITLPLLAITQTGNDAIRIIPEPVSVKTIPGRFELPQQIVIGTEFQSELSYVINHLKSRLEKPTGLAVSVNTSPQPTIQLVLNKNADASIGNEGYKLLVNPDMVTITANKPAGIFYGVQSLLQLFPKEIESAAPLRLVKWDAPAVEITDYPRFEWRGLMFDVVRHFFTKEEVKKYIDNMARYKFNILHLGLTNDEGWRIEIKSLPKLTEVGAWRVKKEGNFGTFSNPLPNEPRDYGGFFTHADIRELVQYASERYVNILPEINAPGHSLAAVASYPELSCTPGADKYVVRSGEKIMDWSRGAPPIALVDNVLCPANEKVYEFLDKVITEVAQLFPFEYIHMGGDEMPENFLEKSPAVKALMKKENLKNIKEVQGYFEKRVEKIVTSKGKKFIGWDEIVDAGLPSSAAVMSWRSMKSGTEAALAKHEVVMTPTQFAYLDYMQADPITEPKIYASLRLSKTYEFDPLPEGVDPKYIKGGQGNLWTEQIYNLRQAEYMTWPRGWAIAESVWSPKNKKNWNSFVSKVEHHFDRSDVAEMKYSPAMYDPSFTATRTSNKQLQIELKTEIPLDIYYSFDNSWPDRFYPRYTGPLIPPKDATTFRVVTYKGKQQVGRMLSMPIEELKTRADKKQNFP